MRKALGRPVKNDAGVGLNEGVKDQHVAAIAGIDEKSGIDRVVEPRRYLGQLAADVDRQRRPAGREGARLGDRHRHRVGIDAYFGRCKKRVAEHAVDGRSLVGDRA